MSPLHFILKNRVLLMFLSLFSLSSVLVIQGHYYHRSEFFSASQRFVGSTHEMVFDVHNYFTLTEYNDLLAEENAQLKSQIQASFIPPISASSKEKTHLMPHYKYLDAKIVYNTFRRPNNYLIINRGTRHGIKRGMGVVVRQGVIGIIENVSNNYSTVISLLHRDVMVNARLNKNNFFGSLVWEDDYQFCKLKDIPKQTNVAIGDTVVTDGKSFVFPEGIPIGTVSEVSRLREQPDYYEITVRLFVNFSNIGYVYVVKNFMKPELNTLLQGIQN